MKNPKLDGVRAKVDRAIDHFKNIDLAIGKLFIESRKGDSLLEHNYTERQELIVTRQKGPPLDPAVSLMVGDCIHNARSALDHLVAQLAVLNRASMEAVTKTSFPVCLQPSEFKNAVRNKIAPFINSSALAEIEKLQPYSTGNDGESDILWVLSQLDIIDKHRLLIVTAEKFRPTAFCVTVPSGEEFSQEIASSNWKPSKDGAEIIRFDLSKAIKHPGKVDVKIETAFAVQIEETGLICDGMILLAVLGDCIQYVANIVNGFGKLFFGE